MGIPVFVAETRGVGLGALESGGAEGAGWVGEVPFAIADGGAGVSGGGAVDVCVFDGDYASCTRWRAD